jgi:hypothetical protein
MIVIKSRLKNSTMSALLLGVLTMLPARTFGQSQGLVAHWAFDETIGATTRDSVSGTADQIEGYVKRVPGVSGNGLRLDGISTHIVRPGKDAPECCLYSSSHDHCVRNLGDSDLVHVVVETCPDGYLPNEPTWNAHIAVLNEHDGLASET